MPRSTRPGRGAHARRGQAALGLRREQTRQRALEALSHMRSQGWSLSRAAREAGTTPATVHAYVGKGLKRDRAGRYLARPTDDIVRPMRFLAPGGLLALPVEGSRRASLLAQYWTAVDRYLTTGALDALQTFQGKGIRVGRRRYPFVTDPRALNRLARAGEVSFEDLYVLTG